jgi:hypothetical protein
MKYFCTFLLLFLSLTLQAQSPNLEARTKSYLPPSPASSKLMQEINHPINYGIGAMDLSIPLYTIKTRDFTLPIVLRCNTSGIKCAEFSGWVALGWTLQAEPIVTREIKGAADENYYIGYNSNFGSSDNFYLGYLTSCAFDEQPDIFYFKTLSNSGKFVFSRPTSSAQSGKYIPLLFPASPEKVTVINNQLSKGFNILDEKGYSYYFGTDTLSTEKSFNTNPNNSNNAYGITTWKGTRIVSPQKDSIAFAYQGNTKGNIKDYAGSLNDFYAVEDLQNSSDTPSGLYPNSGYWKGKDGVMDYYANSLVESFVGNYSWYNIDSYKYTNISTDYPHSPSEVAATSLKTITYEGGHVDFVTTNDKLMEMKIYEGSTLLQTIDFAYQNISIAYHGTGQLLNTLTVTDNVQSTSQTYSFTYYPNYASTMMDCWGYNNGTVQSNTDRVPMQTIYVYSPDNRHEVIDTVGGNYNYNNPQLTNCLSNTINSITYPTGLNEVFTYELHQYRAPDCSYNQDAGGLRIKSILSYNYDGTLLKSRQFTYGEAGEGQILIYPFLRLFEQEYTKIYNYGISGARYSRRYRVYNSIPLKPLDRGFGSPVIYDMVTETEGTGNLKTKTVYTFNNSSYYYNADTTYNTDVKFPYDIPEVWMYNKPATKAEYNVQTNKLLRKRYTTYGKYSVPNTNVSFQPGEAFATQVIDEMEQGGQMSDSQKTYERTLHSINCFENSLPENEQELTWAGDDSIVNIKTYTYGSTANDILTAQPVQTTESTSDYGTITKEWKYPYHLTSNAAAQAMVVRNDLSTPLEMTLTKGSAVSRTVNNFTSATCGQLPYKLSSVQKSNTNTQALYDVEKYNAYDERGNLIEYVRKDGVTVTLLWGYNYQKVVAEIVGVDYNSTMGALGIGYPQLQTMASTSLQSLFQAFRANSAGLITSYTYFPTRGVETMTDPRGVVTGYDYDGMGRLLDSYRMVNGTKQVVESYQYHLVPLNN